MALDEPTETDSTITSGGIDFIYSKTDEPHINDSIIDFEDSYMGKGFVVKNATSTCC
jgi:Fe-S cluster assembly iron-binding protein IscA